MISFTLNKDANTNGTSYKDRISADYHDIVNAFGNPNSKGDGYKVSCEWIIEFEDGLVATIYDWKVGRFYSDDDWGYSYGLAPEEINEWHIGGHTGLVAERVRHILFHNKMVAQANKFSIQTSHNSRSW